MSIIDAGLGLLGIMSNMHTNAQQRGMYNNQIEFQQSMYNDAKWHNSAPNQVRLLRAAGMNPAFAFGNQPSSATATNAPSSPTLNPLDLNGLAAVSSGLHLNDVQAQQMSAETELSRERAVGQSIENKYSADSNLARIANMKIDTRLKGVLMKGAMLDNKLASQSLSYRVRQEQMKAQLEEAEAAARFYTLQYLPVSLQAQIEKDMATAKAALMNGNASLKQAHAAIMSSANQKHAFDAQYGKNDKERAAFARAAYQYLLEQSETERTNQWDKQHKDIFASGARFPNDFMYEHWKKYSHSTK